MMKKEVKSSDDFENLAAVKQDRNVDKNRQAGDKVKKEKLDHASHYVDREVKF